MKVLFHILKFKILFVIKSQGNFNLSSVIKSLGVVTVYSIFVVGVYVLAKNIIAYLLEDVKIGMYLFHRFIFVVLFIFFMAVNIGNIVVSYSTFFKTKEVDFLLTKPLSFTKIFLVKFFDNFFYSSSTLLLIISAVIASYTSYFGLPWYFIPFAVSFIILPFMFIAGTLGAIILLLIMRVAATFGIKKVLVTLTTVYASATILFYYFSSPVNLVTRVFQYFPNINNYFGFLENPIVKLLPNHWVAESLYWITTGKDYAAGWYIYLLIITSVLFFLFSMLIAKKWFYKTWLVFLNLSSELSVKKKNNSRVFFSFENNSSLKPRREALIKRELLLFIREPSQWSHFIVMIFLISIFILSISSVDVIILKSYDVYLKTLVYLVIYLFNVFLIASLSIRFIFPLVSLEGETIWKVRSAPLNYKKLMLTRLFIYFSVIFVIGQVLNFVSNYQFSFLLATISQLNTAFVTITLVSLNFGMGAIFANYKERNPIRVASSQGASLTFLFTIIYLVFLIILLFAPVSNYFYAIERGNLISIAQLIYTSLMLGAVTLVFSYLSISKGVKYFNQDI
jgi:ABC-2 type transport system permease protein